MLASRRLSASANTRTWPTISPALRFLTSPILPVRQKAQAIAHPTWVEIQNVIAGVSGMNTDSMCRPSASSSRNFSVPSVDRSRELIRGVVRVKSVARSERNFEREDRSWRPARTPHDDRSMKRPDARENAGIRARPAPLRGPDAPGWRGRVWRFGWTRYLVLAKELVVSGPTSNRNTAVSRLAPALIAML